MKRFLVFAGLAFLAPNTALAQHVEISVKPPFRQPKANETVVYTWWISYFRVHSPYYAGELGTARKSLKDAMIYVEKLKSWSRSIKGRGYKLARIEVEGDPSIVPKTFPIGSLPTTATIAQEKKFELSQLQWLTGSWAGKSVKSETEEHWIAAKGSMMLGVNRSVSASGKGAFEFLRIASTPKGVIYFASPNGRPATPFTLIKASQSRAVFENRKNRFPQRIIYARDGNQLHVQIEGEIDGKKRVMEWKWVRVK